MIHRTLYSATLIVLIACSTLFGQTVSNNPIKFEVGGSPGGGTWLVGGNGSTESDFNVCTIGCSASGSKLPSASESVLRGVRPAGRRSWA